MLVTALIRKDLYTVFYPALPLLALALLFNLFPTFSALGSTYAILLAFMIPLTAISADEKCKWDRFAAMLPYSVKQIVGSKYLITYLYTLVSAVILLAGEVLRDLRVPEAADWGETAGTVFMLLLVMLLVTTVSLPLLYRFGTQTGRLVMLCVLGAGVGAAAAAIGIVVSYGEPALPPLLLLVIAAAVVGANSLSFRLSVYFYRRRREKS